MRTPEPTVDTGDGREPYYSDGTVTLYHGDCLDVLPPMAAGSVDAVVTDPPYGLGFMGKEWDTIGDTGRGSRVRQERATELTPRGRAHATSAGPYLATGIDSLRSAGQPYQAWCEQWAAECLRVLKPGGHLLAFGGTRTAHRLACAIEDAGFEVRDSIAWLYGSGFPKSRNLDGDWQGWGTALKPAHEPIVVARKPLLGTVAANVLAHGTGALNIDGCRIETSAPDLSKMEGRSGASTPNTVWGAGIGHAATWVPDAAGRWPTNVVLDEPQAAEVNRQSGVSTAGAAGKKGSSGFVNGYDGTYDVPYGDTGGASRFFPTFRYEPKASTGERPRDGATAHPTVKPLDLMRWLVRLVTPPGGLVLEPFAGSGTTAEACVVEGFRCIAIEREADYLPLILARLTKPIETVLDFGAAS